jgi:hypothetical protein
VASPRGSVKARSGAFETQQLQQLFLARTGKALSISLLRTCMMMRARSMCQRLRGAERCASNACVMIAMRIASKAMFDTRTRVIKKTTKSTCTKPKDKSKRDKPRGMSFATG